MPASVKIKLVVTWGGCGTVQETMVVCNRHGRLHEMSWFVKCCSKSACEEQHSLQLFAQHANLTVSAMMMHNGVLQHDSCMQMGTTKKTTAGDGRTLC